MEERKEPLEIFRKSLIIAANILDKKVIDEEALEFIGGTLVQMGNDLLEIANIIRKEKIKNNAIRN